ncbi:TIR domain-containing protein [Sphingomicrobium flavum]|uniref:TIR domain-containing protein n=1 Tax=Sphingomicrobium flavum TaxID=1229164 RepID=UPI0021AD7130|nr:TIR domain-containing protein [Sphingomicrobium flavum]
MADIFISYSSEERATAEQLAAALEARGYSVWWDRNLEGGADFSDDIEREMAEASAILVAWSGNAAKSHWVRDEASYGRDAGKLVPITLDGAQPPIGFRQVQTIDFTGWNGGDDERLTRLASAIDRCCGREPGVDAPVPAATPPTGAASRTAMIVAIVGAILLLLAAGWWFTRGGDESGAAAVVAETSVAVLPFSSLSSDEDDRYFAEGVTQEILNRLAALDELRVTSRSASFQFGGSELPLNEIAEQLHVSHIVEGTVRRSGDDWRVTAQLIRAADNSQLWSDSYDATGDDLLRVQEEIAERAAEALGVLLDRGNRQAMTRAGINNPEAYAMFARTLNSFERAHSGPNQYQELAETVELADRAFALEPKLWQAQLVAIDRPSHLLADSAIGTPIDPDTSPQQAKAEILRRINLAREHAPHSALPVLDQQAIIYSDDWSMASEIVAAVMADRDNCQIGLSYDDFLVQELGLLEEYLEYSRHKIGCDPIQGNAALLEAALYADKADIVRELIDKIDIERGFGPDLRAKVQAHLYLGEIDKAEAVLPKFDRNSYFYFQAMTTLAGAKGDRAELDRLRKFAENFPVFPDAPRLHLALMNGDRALANEIAARIDARPGGTAWLATSANTICYCGKMFDLSATPNFAARLKEAGATQSKSSPIKWPLKDW